MEQEQQKEVKYRVVPVHTPSLTHALSIAMMRDVMVWREVETAEPFSLKELFEFAQRQDREHPLEGHQYYMVTREGAIGISPGVEWLTQWMFLPMEDCKERDFMLMKMLEDVETEQAVQEAVEKAVTEGLAKEKAEKGQPAPVSKPAEAPEPPKPTVNFCPNCGTKILPGNKFCTQCGYRVM